MGASLLALAKSIYSVLCFVATGSTRLNLSFLLQEASKFEVLL